MKTLGAVQYLWALSVAAQVAVCVILVTRGYYRPLTVFTAYAFLNLCQAAFLYLIYKHYGFHSDAAFTYAWWSQAFTLVARVLATTEVLRLVLIPYRGIWGLAWRVLGVTSGVTLVFVIAASRGNLDWGLMEADRGYHLIFAIAIVACLALIRYYYVPVDRTYKAILAGFCFYSCVTILSNTALQGVLYKRYENFATIWQVVELIAYLIVQFIWMRALARPLPAKHAQRPVLPASVYQRISPEIHYQLQAMNKQLMHFWKLEEPGS